MLVSLGTISNKVKSKEEEKHSWGKLAGGFCPVLAECETRRHLGVTSHGPSSYLKHEHGQLFVVVPLPDCHLYVMGQGPYGGTTAPAACGPWPVVFSHLLQLLP